MTHDPFRNNEEARLRKKQRTDEVTRIIALVIAFVGVFVFAIKLLFL